ncbi:hypothetical protein FRC01_003597 [Tulasnella sp. 417]|nr:hypothetical protein FRC01_003597 [Tulasnella sp. 417]
MTQLEVTSHVLEPTQEYPYAVTAKCYTPSPGLQAEGDNEAVTLILTHASGMHKECWEPVIQLLFEHQATSPRAVPRIREAWSIDSPNHGEAAVLNEKILEYTWTEVFPWDDYGRAVGRFLLAGTAQGAGIDFTKRKLWALGHSMGAVSMVWMQQSDEIKLRFERLIIVDPMLSAPGYDLRRSTAYFFPATYQRRDVWPSRQAATKDFKSSRGYKSWDERMIDLFVQYAIRDHPASAYKPAPWNGVTLACGRFHEAACYRGGSDLVQALVPRLAEMSRQVPVSVIFGVIEDSVPRSAKEALANPSISGIQFASVHWVQNAGHLVVQNSPSGVARAVVDAIASKHPEGVDIFPRGAFVIPASYQRRDVWSSRRAALKDFNSSKGYASWNPRILELFVQHALREHPASKIAMAPFNGVTLSCDRFHEAACYRGGIPLGSTICPRLAEISHDIPVSIIFGAVEDSVELKVKEALANSSISNIRCASVHWVEEAGHLVVQNSPHGTAQAILDVFSQVSAPTQTQSKL